MEIDYNEVFGVETTPGANEQEPAQPAPEKEVETTPDATTEEGANETEPAEPSVEEQSKDENAKYAAARRKAEAERDAAVAQARAEAQRTLDESIKALGLDDPFTGKPITNKAEYDAWRVRETEQKRGEVAEAAGMNEREFDAFVNNLPQVKAAKRAAAAAQEQRDREELDKQIKEIGKLDPDIKSVEDLVKREEYPAIYDKVRKGNSIVEAYKLVNFDKLTAAATNAAKQAALNAANSKEHLQATKPAGTGSVTVPADVREMYRQMMPEMTEAQIQEHYNRFHKN